MNKQLLFEHNPNPMLIYDRQTLQIVKGNRKFFDTYKYSAEDVTQKELNIEDIHFPEEFISAKKQYQAAFLNGQTNARVWRHRSKEGRVLHVKLCSHEFPYKDYSSSLLCMVDVSEEVEAHKKPPKAFDELSYHLKNTSLALVQWDDHFQITEWSERAAEISGYSREEVLGKGPLLFNFWNKKQAQRVQQSMQSLMSGEQIRDDFEVKMRNKAGDALPIKIHSSALQDEDGKLISVLTLIEDLTKQKEAEAKKRKSEELFKKLFVNAPQAIVMVDAENKVQRVNSSFQNLFGYVSKELTGQNLDDFIVADDKDARSKKSAITLTSEDIYSELKRYTKTGEEVDVVVGGIPVYLDGKLIAGFGVYIDITSQKKVQRKLERSLEEKQVLLEEVHHRVKNNLAVVSGLLQMQTMHVDDPRLTQYIQNSQLRIRSMGIVHEMLYKSRNLSALNMRNYVHKLAGVIADTLGPDQKDIQTIVESDEIELNINQAIPCALAISELITNAYEYAFEGLKKGKVKVILAKQDEDITVLVKDDGVGLPDNFEKMRKKSLGISLIENLCTQLGTKVNISSDEKGTQFKFTFEKKDGPGSSSSNRI